MINETVIHIVYFLSPINRLNVGELPLNTRITSHPGIF